jgi:hypothetical protein
VEIPLNFDLEHRRQIVGNEPVIFHCHHYNCFLQRSILDAEAVNSLPALIGGGAECAHSQLTAVFGELGLTDAAARKELAQTYYRWAGFGTVDLDPLDADGGTTSTPNSHYGMGWTIKFGASERPVDYFTTGWLAGALAAIYDKPLGHYRATQTACVSQAGSDVSTFELSVGEANYDVFTSPGVGELTTHAPREVPASPVNYEGILQAVAGLDLAGNDVGQANAFGVYLTRHYANYYNRVSFEFMRKLVADFGDEGRTIAEPLLIEAGHVGACNTFGGIMTSTEWDALIRPTLQSKEDWVHGIVAVVNALGWGRWQVTKATEAEAEFVIHDDYEGVGYQAMYGDAAHPVSFLAQGGVAGIMNLIYVGNIEERPTLDEPFYQRLFRETDVYRATSLSSRAMGDAVTSFRVTRGT